MSPLISVIVPTYQRARLLTERCLPSIFAQTNQDFEVHVVGDGTDQATVAAMVEICDRDSRVRFTNLPHDDYPEDQTQRWGLLGLTALNYGLDHAQGEWIAVLADDDAWLPNHNETLLAGAFESGADHIYGISDTYKNGVSIGQTYGAWPPGDGQFCNGANIYRASLGYRYDLNCWDRDRTGDADLWLRMKDDGVKFYFIPKTVHRYHRHYP